MKEMRSERPFESNSGNENTATGRRDAEEQSIEIIRLMKSTKAKRPVITIP
jgi:hypothetical protein